MPTPGNSNTSLANPNSPLTNSNAFSTAINTSPEPLEPSPTISDPIIHHQLTALVFYIPSISQRVPPGWYCPPAFPTNGNNSHIYSEGYFIVLPNSAYLLPAHYYVYPVPAAASAPLEHPDNYSPPHLLFSAQVLSSSR
ncbi:hypothetical protein E4T56_gene20403 [Termitomyces sp. T112]|nr:hypothetical protein E4T56_gene20403 [Termitomyces sp. T112]